MPELAQKQKVKKVRNPLFHIARRNEVPTWFVFVVKLSFILGALLLCGIISFLVSPITLDEMPEKFISYYIFVVEGTFFNMNTAFSTLWNASLLLIIAAAITPAFKMKFWNIGAEGQVLMGCFGAAIVMKFIAPSIPNFLALILMLALALIFAAAWAAIPAIFKAFFNTNETLFTLMMNYIAMGVVEFFVFFVDPTHGAFAGLTAGVYNFATSTSILISTIVVVVMTGFMFVYLNFTKHGYELSVVGETRNTAKYIGINVKAVIIRTAIICGVLAGIMGYLVVAKQTSVNKDIIGGKGFTAVMIAWLGHVNVIEIVIMAFLVAFITRGSNQVATKLDLNTSFIKITIATFLITILAFEFFLNYEIHFNKNFFKRNKELKEVKE